MYGRDSIERALGFVYGFMYDSHAHDFLGRSYGYMGVVFGTNENQMEDFLGGDEKMSLSDFFTISSCHPPPRLLDSLLVSAMY